MRKSPVFNKSRPRVSVLLPMHDAETTVRAALESVRRQSLQDWECVIVDDGSTDASAEEVRAFTRSDERFRLLRREHGGIVAALNAGLDACRAPLVARMDADDLMHRDRLTAQLDLIESTDLDAAGTHVRVFPRDPMTDGARRYEAWLNAMTDPESIARDRFIECPIAHPTLMIRKELLNYRDRGWPEDYDLILRLLDDGLRVGVVPRRLLAWRDSPQRLQRTNPAYTQERFVACKAAHLASGFLRGNPEFVLWGHGGTGRALRRELAHLGKRPSSIVELHPRRLGNVIDGAPVLEPSSLLRTPGPRVVVSVAGARARSEIRSWLLEAGFTELESFVVAA